MEKRDLGADAQGQLGLQSATGLKTHVMPIDELRSKDFIQVVTGGCNACYVYTPALS